MIKLTIIDAKGNSSVREFGKNYADLAFQASQAYAKLGFRVILHA